MEYTYEINITAAKQLKKDYPNLGVRRSDGVGFKDGIRFFSDLSDIDELYDNNIKLYIRYSEIYLIKTEPVETQNTVQVMYSNIDGLEIKITRDEKGMLTGYCPLVGAEVKNKCMATLMKKLLSTIRLINTLEMNGISA